MKEILKKIISTVTVLAIMAGSTVSFATGEESDVLFSENYDGATYKQHIKGAGELTTDTENGNKYMLMDMTVNGGGDMYETAFAYSIPAITEGLIQINFDYMTNATSGDSYILLANSSKRGGGEWLRLLGAVDGSFNAFSKSYALGSAKAGKWYSYQATIDMESHEVSAAIYDRDSQTLVGNMSATLSRTSSSYSDWPRTSNEFVEFRHYGANDGYIDNIEIKTVYKDLTFIFGEDYQSSIQTPIASGSGSLVTDDSGNKYMRMTGAWSANQFGYSIPALSKGKIKIEFDYMKEDTTKQTYITLAGKNDFYTGKKWLRLLGSSSSGVLTAFTHDKSVGSMEANTWYSYKGIINFNTHEVSAEVYEKGSETPIGSIHYDKLPDFAEMNSSYGYTGWPEDTTEFICIRHFGDADGFIDNIKINYVYDDPVLQSNNVTIETDDGIVQTNHNDVIKSAKTIKIDFGTSMRDKTMTGDYIYVTKKGDTDKVSANVTYTDGVVTLKAANNWDVGDYTLHVSKDVANFLGVTMSSDFTTDFTTVASKVVKAVFTDIDNNEILYSENIKISPEITKLTLYLEGDIDGDIVSEIALTSKNANVNAEEVYDSENKTYTFNFMNYLKQKSSYSINVPVSVTTNGYSETFETGDGKYEVLSVDFKDATGNTPDEIPAISSLDVKILNTAGKTESYRLIFTSYSGKKLKNMTYKDFDVTTENANIDIKLPVSFDVSADSVKKLLWTKKDTVTENKGITSCDISADKVVTFTNKLTSGKDGANVIISVYSPGKSESNLLSEAENNSVLAYYDYTTSKAEGEYTFTFEIDGAADFYDVVVTSDGGDKDVYKIFYNDKVKADTLRVSLNRASDADTFYNLLYDAHDSYKELGFYSNLSETADNRKVSDLMYQYVNNTQVLDATDDVAAIKIYKKMYAIELLNENKLVSLNEMDEYLNILEEDFAEYYSKSYITDSVKTEIYNALKGRNFTSETEYKKAFIEQLVLKTVRYSDGYGNVRDILTSYQSETGINNTNYNVNNYTSVLGKTYTNYSALAAALVQSNNSYVVSGGGSGSSGSGSSSKKDGVKLTVDNTLISAPVAVPVKTEIFNDISDYGWAKEAIECLYENDVISGKSDNEFCPQDNITREEFATLIVRAMGLTDVSDDIEFTDVPDGAWYSEYIKAAAIAGLIYGKEDSSFGVGENISRQDMAVIICRAIKSEQNSDETEKFTDDESIANYAKNAVYAMLENNIIAGFEDGSFMPTAEASRAQAAVMIYRAFYK